ncbi:MAG: hypothetical protein BalsKO_10930 [Balneolaceae bacterium]
MLRIAHLFLIILIFKALPIFGQGFSILPQDYSEFLVQEYLINDLTQDSSGKVYFATHLNVLVFDGLKWRDFHIGESGRVTVINETNVGLIAGGENKLVFIKPDSLNNFSFNFIDTNEDKHTIYWDILDSNQRTLIRNFYGINVIESDTSLYIKKDSVSGIFDLGEEILVNYYKDGLAYLLNNKLYDLPGSGMLKDYDIRFVSKIGNKLVVGAKEYGFFEYRDTSFFPIFPEASEFIIKNDIYGTTKLSNNDFILATEKGGAAIMNNKGEIIDVLNKSKGLPSNTVYGVYETEESIVWIGTKLGIAKALIIPGFRKIYSENNELGEFKNIELTDSLIFVLTEDGLFRKNWKRSSSKFTSINVEFDFSDIKSFGERIIAASDSGLFVIDALGIKRFTTESIDNLYRSDKFLYAVHDQTLLQIDKELDLKFIELPIYDPMLYNFKDHLFMSLGERIFLLADDKSKKELNFKNKFADLTIQKMGEINDNFYIGTNSGLFIFDEIEKAFKKDTIFFKDNKQVFQFNQCSSNEVWFNHNKEIKRAISSRDSLSIITNQYRIIGQGNSVYDIECGDNGDVWFGGVNGLYHLTDPGWDYKTDFKTNITDIYVNRDSLIYGGFGEPVKPIVLPYKDNELRFNYAAASYIDETRNTYSYKLEGFDSDWSEWSLETQKDYTNIPEGEYVFNVRSRNVYEVDGRPDQISFTVLPPWYRTWWAYMVYFISFSGLLFTVYKIRLNQLLKVERMRNKIASDLHDEVSATLTGISYFAEAIKRDKDQSKAAHFVSLISESAGDAKEKITDIVWFINPENDSWELFLAKCRRFASDLLESKELEYTLKITEHVPGKLSMEVRQHLWMIFKEMVTNAVRHSEATRLDIIMDIENGILKLIVQDNGKGFDVDETKDGNGIRNIRKRAVKIGAVIKIHSEEDFGTRWRMELPL